MTIHARRRRQTTGSLQTSGKIRITKRIRLPKEREKNMEESIRIGKKNLLRAFSFHRGSEAC